MIMYSIVPNALMIKVMVQCSCIWLILQKLKDQLNQKIVWRSRGGFLVRRKYFRSEYEAQEYIDSLPNAIPMSRNESIRRSNKSMIFEATGKKCYVVIELQKDKSPKLIGVFYNKKDA